MTLQLLVEKEESVLTVCDPHAAWLRGYVSGDDAVEVIDEGSHPRLTG